MARNLPLRYSEIDLVFLVPQQQIWLVEVKSVYAADLAFRSPVSPRQRLRLARALERWQQGTALPVRLHLAAVNQLNEVTVFEDFLAG